MTTPLEELFRAKLPSVQSRLREIDGRIRFRVAWQDLHSGAQYGVNAHEPGWAASMIKVPVMVAVFKRIDEGELSLEDTLTVDHRFTLDPTSEISYRAQGSPAQIQELLPYMILASCNESTNLLADRVGIPYLNETMRKLSCPSTRMSHLLYHRAPLVDSGIDGTSSNTTTAAEMNHLMASIYRDTAASAESCRHMRAILENSPELEYGGAVVNTLLSSALPPRAHVGAKMGLLDEDVMETGVINNDYALTIMLNKVPSRASSLSSLLPTISREVFQRYYHGQQKTIDGDRERI